MPRLVRSFMCSYCPMMFEAEVRCIKHERLAHPIDATADRIQISTLNDNNGVLLQTIATLLKEKRDAVSTLASIERLMDDDDEMVEESPTHSGTPVDDVPMKTTTNGWSGIEVKANGHDSFNDDNFNMTHDALPVGDESELTMNTSPFVAEPAPRLPPVRIMRLPVNKPSIIPATSKTTSKTLFGKSKSSTSTPPASAARRPTVVSASAPNPSLEPSLKRPLDSAGKPVYKCLVDDCGTLFTNRNSLIRHHLIHTGERPFQCSSCDASFNQKVHLRRHAARIHADSSTPASPFTIKRDYSPLSMVSQAMHESPLVLDDLDQDAFLDDEWK